jgi:hypothetical protein
LARVDRKRKKNGSNDDWTHPHRLLQYGGCKIVGDRCLKFCRRLVRLVAGGMPQDLAAESVAAGQ